MPARYRTGADGQNRPGISVHPRSPAVFQEPGAFVGTYQGREQRLNCSYVGPIANANADLLGALHDSGSQVRTEQASVCGFVCQAADGSEPKVDSRRRVVRLLKKDAVASHNGFVERQEGL